jgi:hypothetical protein
VTAQVSVIGDVPDRRLLSLGDPIAADVPAGLIVGANVGDIVGIAPDDRLKEGTVYTVVGAVSAATVDTLASSRTDYPTAIRERYTQSPGASTRSRPRGRLSSTCERTTPIRLMSLTHPHSVTPSITSSSTLRLGTSTTTQPRWL